MSGQGDEMGVEVVAVQVEVGITDEIVNVYDGVLFDDSILAQLQRRQTGRGFPSVLEAIILGGERERLGDGGGGFM